VLLNYGVIGKERTKIDDRFTPLLDCSGATMVGSGPAAAGDGPVTTDQWRGRAALAGMRDAGRRRREAARRGDGAAARGRREAARRGDGAAQARRAREARRLRRRLTRQLDLGEIGRTEGEILLN
jgi:hypothetical protein